MSASTEALTVLPSWAWIPIVLWAAIAQTARNAAQRSLTGRAGTLGATLTRFLYGLPFTAVCVFAIDRALDDKLTLSAFDVRYFVIVAGAALSQAAATALLLLAMQQRNFVVAVTYSKTEVLQAAMFGTLFLNEVPSVISLASMATALIGVVLMTLPGGGATSPVVRDRAGSTQWVGRSAMYAIASGTGFAVAAVGYRAGGVDLVNAGHAPWVVGTWTVLWAQLMQSATIVGWLLLRNPGDLRDVFRAWPTSLAAGMAGAIASIAWFTAYLLRPAADVRMLGMVEVVFSYLVSRRLLREQIGALETIGLTLVTAGVGVSLGSF